MVDTQAKKILTAPWAETGDRTDPDDASLTPPLQRTLGWPASFSADDGDTPRRTVMNQRFRELDGLATDVMREGVLGWDADIDYRQHAIVRSGTLLYRATVATGPATSNATDPQAAGQTVWERIVGEVNLPSAPVAPQATTPMSGETDWFWDCPLDGGRKIESFDFQWRVAGASAWSASVVVTTARHVLTGLTNGVGIEARVRARTSFGVSPWSPIGSATPHGAIPGGGASLALRATGGDTRVTLDWLEPDDGGVAIIAYIIQWREPGQNYSTSREMSTGSTNFTVTGLMNQAEYVFRVRAVNAQGTGPWSNEATAMTAPAVPDMQIPAVAAAPSTQTGIGTVTWIAIPPDARGAAISAYQWRWRAVGASAWSAIVTTATHLLTRTGLTNGTAYEAQVRAVNSVGTQSQWSPSGTGTPMAQVPDAVQLVHLTNEADVIRATWGVPDGNGAAIIQYQLQWFLGDFTTTLSVSTLNNTTGSVSPVTEGLTYLARVRAQNSVGYGPWSPVASIVYDDGVDVPGAIPAAPLGHPGGQRIQWTWDEPSSDGGEALIGFDFQWRRSGSAWSGNIIRVGGSSYLLIDLMEQTAYQARVRAVNGDGPGPWSATGSATTTVLSYEQTAAGTYSFSWPWLTSRGRIELMGGDGGGQGGQGGEGGGETSADDGSLGAHGQMGGATFAIVNGTTYFAAGGSAGGANSADNGGGRGGHGGAGGSGGSSGPVQQEGGPDISFAGPSGSQGSFGDNGGAGASVIVEITGISNGDIFTITVGAGGVGGSGGAGGGGGFSSTSSTTGSPVSWPGSNGGPGGMGFMGDDGSITIIPLY